jgi:hypothetical protein
VCALSILRQPRRVTITFEYFQPLCMNGSVRIAKGSFHSCRHSALSQITPVAYERHAIDEGVALWKMARTRLLSTPTPVGFLEERRAKTNSNGVVVTSTKSDQSQRNIRELLAGTVQNGSSPAAAWSLYGYLPARNLGERRDAHKLPRQHNCVIDAE